jgi:threonine/homoserine/homoserine lactone efflux protein
MVDMTPDSLNYSLHTAFEFLVKSAIIGFCAAVPVGPIGALCIRRSLAYGRPIGLATGFGAATADAVYGSVAAFGLTAISGFLVSQRSWIDLPGGLLLCFLGVVTFLKKPVEQDTEIRSGGLLWAYLSSLFLTLTNPMTILSFMAIYAVVGLGAPQDYLSAIALVAGVFVGSALWWLLLSGIVSLFRLRVSSSLMQAINRVAGGIIAAFGLYSVLRFLFR